MSNRLTAAILGAALLLPPGVALAHASKGDKATTPKPTGIEARLRRDEHALMRTESDLADIVRDRFNASEKKLSAAARQDLAEAKAATTHALDRVRKSIADAIGSRSTGKSARK